MMNLIVLEHEDRIQKNVINLSTQFLLWMGENRSQSLILKEPNMVKNVKLEYDYDPCSTYKLNRIFCYQSDARL